MFNMMPFRTQIYRSASKVPDELFANSAYRYQCRETRHWDATQKSSGNGEDPKPL